MPNEILLKILRYVAVKDLDKSVALVNRRFLALTRTPTLCTHIDTTGMSLREATNRIDLAHRNLHTVKIEGMDLRLLGLSRHGFRPGQEVRTIVICS
jgi:hypothetical protein